VCNYDWQYVLGIHYKTKTVIVQLLVCYYNMLYDIIIIYLYQNIDVTSTSCLYDVMINNTRLFIDLCRFLRIVLNMTSSSDVIS